MYVEIHILGADVTADLFKQIKSVFNGKDDELYITVDNQDESAYLMASEANREHLLRSMKQIEKGETVTYSLNDLRIKAGLTPKRKQRVNIK